MFFKPNVKKLKEKGDVKGLIKALRHKDPSIRKDAAKALGDLKANEAVEELIDALKDSNTDVRIEVVRALGKIKDEKAINPLIDVVREEKSLDIKLEALRSLKDIGYSKATEMMVGLVSQYLKIPKEVATKMVSEGKVFDLISDKGLLGKLFKILK